MYAPRLPTPTPTMYYAAPPPPARATTTTAAGYGTDAAAACDDANPMRAYAAAAADPDSGRWLALAPQNSDRISYTSHGGGAAPYGTSGGGSSTASTGPPSPSPPYYPPPPPPPAALIPRDAAGCAASFGARVASQPGYGTTPHHQLPAGPRAAGVPSRAHAHACAHAHAHAACPSHPPAPAPTPAAHVKQEIKQEDGDAEMAWLASPVDGAPPYAASPAAAAPAAHYGTTFVKPEPAYAAYDAPPLGHPYGYPASSASPADYGLLPEVYPGSHALAADYDELAQAPPWPYAAAEPPHSPADDAYAHHHHHAYAYPAPLPNHRSYTLENAMTPVTPVDRAPPPPAAPSAHGRPPMGSLPRPDDGEPPAPPASGAAARQTAGTQTAGSSTHGQPVRRGRGRPKKHAPPSTRASPPPAPAPVVNYPYPPPDAPVRAPPPSRWTDAPPPSALAPAPAPQVSLDEIPFPEGAEPPPGQQMFKLTSPGVPREPAKKKPIMACLFCRERKIACGPPAQGAAEQRCNQCARRDLVCEYPKESRRGMHKRFPRAPKTATREHGEPGHHPADGADFTTTPTTTTTTSTTDEPEPADARSPSSSSAPPTGTRDPRKAAQRRGATTAAAASVMHMDASAAA